MTMAWPGHVTMAWPGQVFSKSFVTLFHVTAGDPWPETPSRLREDGKVDWKVRAPERERENERERERGEWTGRCSPRV